MLTQNGNSRSTGEERPMSGLNPYTKKRTTNGFYARSLFRQPITRWREPGNVKSPHPQPRTLTRRETSSETLRLTLVNIYRVRCELSRNNLYSYRHFFPFSRISRSIPCQTDHTYETIIDVIIAYSVRCFWTRTPCRFANSSVRETKWKGSSSEATRFSPNAKNDKATQHMQSVAGRGFCNSIYLVVVRIDDKVFLDAIKILLPPAGRYIDSGCVREDYHRSIHRSRWSTCRV